MPTTQIAAGRAFTYVNNIGRISRSGPGFRHPVGLARGHGDVLYVANWGEESDPNARITKCALSTQEWIADLGSAGTGQGQFLWPGGLASDTLENLYVTDQADDKIVVFSKDGAPISKWGQSGANNGQLCGPSGLAFDSDGNLLVVDTKNHRVQKFTKDGQFLAVFGTEGSQEGQFDMPWGIAVDEQNNSYVADWGNNRVQKFTPDGKHQYTIGSPGKGKGQLNHPSDVAIDQDGDIYVADWGNHRVIIYEGDGTYLATINGDATNLSEWGKGLVAANPDLAKARARADLQPESLLWRPSAIHVGSDYKIIIAEAQHMRVQIYQKDPAYQDGQFNL